MTRDHIWQNADSALAIWTLEHARLQPRCHHSSPLSSKDEHAEKSSHFRTYLITQNEESNSRVQCKLHFFCDTDLCHKIFKNYFCIFSGIWENVAFTMWVIWLSKKGRAAIRKTNFPLFLNRFKDPKKKIKDLKQKKKEKSTANPHALATQLKNRMPPETHTSPKHLSPRTSVLLSPDWTIWLQS